MALLLDTSVLVKVFTAEEGSPAAIALLHRPGVLHVGPLTEHELSCALNRKRLAGVLRPAEAAEIEADFRALLEGSLRTVPFTDALSRQALSFIHQHGLLGLRTLDAIQLAACLELPKPELATADRRLAVIAERRMIRVSLI